MKMLIATALIVAATPAIAQTDPQTPAPATKTPGPMAVTKLTLDTPLETIVADPKGKAVLDADLAADITTHPMYESFKGMTLNQLAPVSNGKLTPALLKKLGDDLAAVK